MNLPDRIVAFVRARGEATDAMVYAQFVKPAGPYQAVIQGHLAKLVQDKRLTAAKAFTTFQVTS
jgi:hypothetical protein